MAKKIAFLLVLFVWALTIQSSVSKDALVKDEESKAGENMQDAHEKAESWMHWAQFKLSKLGLHKEIAREAIGNIVNRAGYPVSKTTETMKSVASGLPMYASPNEGTLNGGRESVSLSNVYEETKDRLKMVINLALDKASGAYQVARQKLNGESDLLSNKAGDGKSSVSRGNGHTTEQAAEAYGEAVHNVKKRYKTAKETMNDQDKARYEAAKEKASDSAGNLGNELRDRMAEL